MDSSASTVTVAAVYKGIDVFAGNFANEMIDESALRDLKKLRRLNFTVKYVYSNAFKITAQSARAKVKLWQDAGFVEKIGILRETNSTKPSDVFGIVNPLIGKFMFSNLSAQEFANKKLKACVCGLLLIRDWDENPEYHCQSCGRSGSIPKIPSTEEQ
jgi:hypothetical protein